MSANPTHGSCMLHPTVQPHSQGCQGVEREEAGRERRLRHAVQRVPGHRKPAQARVVYKRAKCVRPLASQPEKPGDWLVQHTAAPTAAPTPSRHCVRPANKCLPQASSHPPGEGVQVCNAAGQQGVAATRRPCQLRQPAVQRHPVLHVGCLAPLHHWSHALRPAVQAIRVGQQLGSRAGGTGTGGNRNRCLVIAAGWHKELRAG